MPITDRLMQTGAWSLQLTPRAPDAVRKAIATLGSQIYFTPADIPDDGIAVADLRLVAFYGGMVTRRNKRTLKFGGPGMLGWVVSGRGGAGAVSPTVSPARPATFTQIIQSWLDPANVNFNNGIQYGTAYSATATTINNTDFYSENPPFKSLLDTYAKTTGNEYRLRTTGLLDWGISTALFNSSPNVLIAPGLAGREGTLKALDVDPDSWDPAGDIDNFRNNGYVLKSDKSAAAVGLAAAPGKVRFARFDDPHFHANYVSDPIIANSTDGTDIVNMAQAASDEFSTEHLSLPAQVREYCLHRFAIPGDYVWVHDPDSDIVDRSNPQTFQGDTIFPKTMRLMGFTSPVEAGMGVRVVSGEVLASGDAEIVNVTNYVRWERGRTSLELDSLPYRLGDVGSRTALR